ncbi:MAG TPA: hypothetical protein DCF63_02810 [Planctomycetaceae bacterium]|nr:hypothetical protein [Planctomycetaceae bacterium]
MPHSRLAVHTIAFILLACAGMNCSVPRQAFAQGGDKAIKAVVQILTGAAAAESLGRFAQARERRDSSKALVQQESETLRRLRQQGVDSKDAAVYSAKFSLNTNVNAVLWSDYLSRADVF